MAVMDSSTPANLRLARIAIQGRCCLSFCVTVHGFSIDLPSNFDFGFIRKTRIL